MPMQSTAISPLQAMDGYVFAAARSFSDRLQLSNVNITTLNPVSIDDGSSPHPLPDSSGDYGSPSGQSGASGSHGLTAISLEHFDMYKQHQQHQQQQQQQDGNGHEHGHHCHVQQIGAGNFLLHSNGSIELTKGLSPEEAAWQFGAIPPLHSAHMHPGGHFNIPNCQGLYSPVSTGQLLQNHQDNPHHTVSPPYVLFLIRGFSKGHSPPYHHSTSSHQKFNLLMS